jgi:hypothetical protein
VFSRFDVNSNEVLDTPELWRAFPLVQPVVLQCSNGLAVTEDLQKAIFSWLIVFGEPPKVDLVGGAKILAWSLARHVVNEQADRLDLLKVMGAIGTASREARVKKIGEFWNTKSREQLRAEIVARESGTVSELTALFQCLPTAADTLGADLKHNIDYLFPRGKSVAVESFITGVKSVIAVDPRLNNLCLPF